MFLDIVSAHIAIFVSCLLIGIFSLSTFTCAIMIKVDDNSRISLKAKKMKIIYYAIFVCFLTHILLKSFSNYYFCCFDLEFCFKLVVYRRF